MRNNLQGKKSQGLCVWFVRAMVVLMLVSFLPAPLYADYVPLLLRNFGIPYITGGFAVDKDSNVYVANAIDNRVQIFNRGVGNTGNLIYSLSHELTDPLLFPNPQGMAVDSSGKIYVSDQVTNHVTIFEGSESQTPFNTLHTLTGFVRPFGVAIGGTGKIYIADYYEGTVKIFDNSDSTVPSKTLYGMVNPAGITVDGSGKIYITDIGAGSTGAGTVKIFDSSESTTPTILSGFSNPSGVAVDSMGRIYISDTNNYCMKIFKTVNNQDGTISYPFLREFASGQAPYGVVLDKDDYVYVADNWSKSVQIFWPGWDKWVAGETSATPHLANLSLGTAGLQLNRTGADANTLVVPNGSTLNVDGFLDTGNKTLKLDGGSLNVTTGPVFVESGGVLDVTNFDTFNVKSLRVEDGGTLLNRTFKSLPVESIVLFDNSTVNVAVGSKSEQAGSLKATGVAHLRGSLKISFISGGGEFQDGTSYTVLTAGHINGQFGSVGFDPDHALSQFLSFDTVYRTVDNNDAVQLTLHLKDTSTGGSGQVVSPSLISTTTLAQSNAISRRLESGGKESNPLSNAEFAPRPISIPTPSVLQRFREMQQLGQRRPQPDMWSTLYSLLEQNGPVDLEKELSVTGRWNTSFWISPSYTRGKNKATVSSGASQDSFETLVGGIEFHNEETNELIGFTVGGGFGDTKSRLDRDNKSLHKSLLAGAYHSMRWGGLRWDQFGNVNWLFSDHNRVGTSGGRYIAKGKDTTDTYAVSTEVSYKFSSQDYLVFRPYYGVDYWHISRGKYREEANPAPLSRPRQGSDGFDHYAGFMLRKTWTDLGDYSRRLQGDFWYAYDLSTVKNVDKVFAVRDGSFVQIPIPGLGKRTFSPSITASLMNKKSQSKYFFTYAAAIQSKRVSHQISFKLQYLL